MSADTALMPIAGAVDPVPVARDTTPRADGRVDLVGLTKDADPRRARGGRARREAGQAARQADLALDLQPRRRRLRGDDRHRQDEAAVARARFVIGGPR